MITTQLEQTLLGRRRDLAGAAQRVYDSWDEDGRGICAQVAGAFAELLTAELEAEIEAEVFVLDIEGDEGELPHTLCFVETESECFSVDLPYGLYEEGHKSGREWAWTRKSGVTFRARDVVIAHVQT